MKIFINYYLHKQKNENAISDVFTYVIDHYDGDDFIFNALGDFNKSTKNQNIYNINNKFFRLLKKISFFLKTDAIWTVQGDRFSFFIKKIFMKKLIVSFHGDDKTIEIYRLNNKINVLGCYRFGIVNLFKSADIIIPLTKYVKRYLDKEYTSIIEYIYNGVDFDFFKGHGNDKKDFIVCFVGSYVRRKRPDLVFKIAEKLPKINFIMAGGNIENSYLSSLDKPLNVKSIGWQDRNRIKEVYLESSIMIFPSISEGFSLAMLEANACGLPVVTSNIPIFREFIQDGNGTLIDIDENELENYIKAIKKYQNYIPDTRGFILKQKQFFWENVSKNYIQLFQKIKD